MHLHILFDPNIKAIQGWKAVVEPWSPQHVRDSLNGATLKRHLHLLIM
jgi:hypothetical protein